MPGYDETIKHVTLVGCRLILEIPSIPGLCNCFYVCPMGKVLFKPVTVHYCLSIVLTSWLEWHVVCASDYGQ